MLVELRCKKFNENNIFFHEGLNVVLGDEAATNSIGKSSLLMVLDFAFGGESLLEHSYDIVKELGDHDYWFTFEFDNKKYHFRRNTHTPDLVYKCNADFEDIEAISNDDYKAFLKAAYSLDHLKLSFRAIVSLFSRIWGKDNYDVKQPLHTHKNQPSRVCIENLIKLYEKYDEIDQLSEEEKRLSTEKQVMSKAFKQNLIPAINKTQYKQNLQRVSDINEEISDIKENLSKYAVNISEIVNRETSELKLRKDALLREKSKTSSRLTRVRNDLKKNRHIKSKAFESLADFFPDANLKKFAEVEEFHSSITKILKHELKESEKELAGALENINSAINAIDEQIESSLSNIDNPSVIIDRVHSLTNQYTVAQREIQYFESDDEVKGSLKGAKAALKEAKEKISKLIADILNNKTRQYVDVIYNESRRSPVLSISENSYAFKAEEDTGTGKAYSSLVTFDIAALETSILPFLIHDSFLFKNIENDAVAQIVKLYAAIEKQTFIAIDEIQKYGTEAAETLKTQKVLQLDNEHMLYIKDWRK